VTVDNLEERLAEQQELYNQAPAASGDPSELPPDGTYQVLIRRWDFFESKAGVAYLKLESEVALDPEYQGRSVDKIWNLEPRANQSQDQWRQSLSFLKGDLKTIGVPPETPLTEIRPGSAVLEAVLDVPLQIVIKTSEKTDADGNPYRNVYINERLGGPMRSTADVPADTADFGPPPAGHAAADEDIPF
jgi:hypothetical protein